MLKLFYKSDGAISVFLSLILLPVMIVGLMTTDAARIYTSKAVISDAGEMAINAGLAQYDEALHDEYGMFVMKKDPASMQAELEKYFSESLSGTETANYNKILKLVEESFNAINVPGSEIYQTEVEKQQILEYMKYRAPVCLAEQFWDKLEELKDTKKMMEAMEAEMDFCEAMEDCQDAFKKAKTALDQLNQALNSFPVNQKICDELENAKNDFTGKMARCLLMRAAIQRYSDKSSNTDLKEMIKKFVDKAKKVDLSENVAYSFGNYENYISSIYYKNTVEHIGGTKKLLKDYDDKKKENSTDNEDSNDEDRKELENLVKEYNEQKARLEGYNNVLLSIAGNVVDVHYGVLNRYYEDAGYIEALANVAYIKLNDVKKELEEAADKFKNWKEKTDALGNKKGEMKDEVDEYSKFFSNENGENSDNLKNLDLLIEKIEMNKEYFKKLKKTLEGEKFFGLSIATTAVGTQKKKYNSEASGMMDGKSANRDSIETAGKEYVQNYKSAGIDENVSKISITDDKFYKTLQEYCKEGEDTDSEEEQKQANESLDKSKDAGNEAKKEDDYPNYDWSNAGVELPSFKIGVSGKGASDKLTNLDIDGNVKKSGARRNAIKRFKESIQEATIFLSNMENIIRNGIERVCIAEYAMQMGSYYTVNKKDGKTLSDDEIITISGYKMKNHKAYRAECEYVLWGNMSSRKNICYTVMTIFGIRLLFNCFFAFTNETIVSIAQTAANAIAGAAPYLIPIVKVVIQLGLAGVETSEDIKDIKEGYGVAIVKDSDTWETIRTGTRKPDNNQGVTLDYSEYLRVFLYANMFIGKEANILARIGDMIQVNTKIDLITSYTMLAIKAKVGVKTTFLRKIADWSGGGWQNDSYSVEYKSILGY